MTSVDPALVVDALGGDDLARLCLDVHVFGATALTDDQLLAYDCALATGFGSLSATLGSAACRRTYESCAATPPDRVRADVDFRACTRFKAAAMACSLRVGAFSQCLMQRAQRDVSAGNRGESVCDVSGAADAGAASDAGSDTCAACTALVDYAAAIVEGGSGR